MKIDVEVTLSKEYYQEFYTEWLQFRSKARKWQVQIGLFLFGISLLLVALSGQRWRDFWLFPCFFLLAGVYEIGSFYYSRWQWFQSRQDSRLLNQRVTMSFQPHAIQHNGPFSQGELQWRGLRQIKETAKGVFLIPENGISIYLPKQAFQSATQIQQILKHLEYVHQQSAVPAENTAV